MSGKYSAVIGRFMSQYLNNEKLTVVSPGTQKRDFTHVKDIVKGLIKLIDQGDGEEFQFGTGKNYTILEIAQAFKHPIEIIPERQGERFEGLADKDESTKKINWNSEIDVLDYVNNFVKMNKHEW
jgi:UDP-glucose 4-epimerase